MDAVGEHLPPQSEWRPPAASPSHPGRAPAPSLASRVPGVPPATPARHAAARAPGTHRYGRGAGTVPERTRAPFARGCSPWACRVPPLSAPPPPPLSGSLARSLRRPVGPAGTGGAEEGRGCVPPTRGRGGSLGACCQRAGEGRAAPPHRARTPGGSALAETVGAGGGGRAWQARKGREGRAERGSVRGGAPGPGEGLGATGRGLQLRLRGQDRPARPHRAWSAARGLARPWAASGGTETQGGFRGRRGGGT